MKQAKPNKIEDFKVITYPGIKSNKYLIGNNGTVININTNKKMKTYFDKDGYERITLVTNIKHPSKRGNKSKHYGIHRLVLWEFIGPPPNQNTCISNHKDGFNWHNYSNNLEWTTPLGNTLHAKSIGIMNESGLNSHNCKYEECLIRQICELTEQGLKPIEIYNIIWDPDIFVSVNAMKSLVNKIRTKTSYFDLTSEYNFKSSMKSPKNAIRYDIRKLIVDGLSNQEILNRFSISKISENPKLYNQIIEERAKSKVIFNDYRKLNNNSEVSRVAEAKQEADII